MEAAAYTLITGASSGIGRAAALRFSNERKLILHGRDLNRLSETRQMCANPTDHILWQADLKVVERLAESLTPLLAGSGRAVEAFVHCAGMVTVLPARSADYPAVLETMNVNFFAAAEITRLLLRKSVNGKRLSAVVFVSSIFSRFGARGHSTYCASKAALDGFMRALAVELAPGVRVNSILPGAIRTPMATDAFADPVIVAKLQKDYLMGLGETEDVVDAIEFLFSAKARWLTGQEIVVDGGRTVNMSLQ